MGLIVVDMPHLIVAVCLLEASGCALARCQLEIPTTDTRQCYLAMLVVPVPLRPRAVLLLAERLLGRARAGSPRPNLIAAVHFVVASWSGRRWSRALAVLRLFIGALHANGTSTLVLLVDGHQTPLVAVRGAGSGHLMRLHLALAPSPVH
jgi:hypothetical protein